MLSRQRHPDAPASIVRCKGNHGPRQRIVVREDGTRTQVCERCGAIVATLPSVVLRCPAPLSITSRKAS